MVEAIAERAAERTVELLREQYSAPRATPTLIDAAAVAVMLGTSRQWVYANAEALGGQRLGEGPRPRLRFDAETVRAWGACSASKQSQAQGASARAESEAAERPRRRRLPHGQPQPGSVLAIRPRSGTAKAKVSHAV
jgi:hypothetical protein